MKKLPSIVCLLIHFLLLYWGTTLLYALWLDYEYRNLWVMVLWLVLFLLISCIYLVLRWKEKISWLTAVACLVGNVCFYGSFFCALSVYFLSSGINTYLEVFQRWENISFTIIPGSLLAQLLLLIMLKKTKKP